MKILFDLLPIILFFAAYKVAGAHDGAALDFATRWLGDGISASQAPILIATAVAIVATVGQIAWVRFRHGRVDRMMWISLGLIVVLGGATLVFHNPDFIKWKPTALYWLFAMTLIGSAVLLQKNLIRAMLQQQIRLPDPVWTTLNLAWSVFFVLMGALNLYVAYSFSEDAWVNFKLFGGLGLMLLFVLGQGYYLSRHIIEEETTA